MINLILLLPIFKATVQHQIEAKKPQMISYIWPKIC